MILNTLTLKNFKKFGNKTLEFNSGLNILVGDNESGKSTILKAIITALFGDVNTKSRTLFKEISAWNQKKKQKPILTLDFSVGPDDYSLTKNFEKESVLLTKRRSKETWDDNKVVNNIISKLTGIGNEDVYKTTGSISHDDISDFRKSKNLLNAIQTGATDLGKDENAHGVIKKIDSEIKDIERGLKSPAKNPGLLKTLQDKSENQESQLRKDKEEWNKFINEGQKLTKLAKDYTDSKAELDRLKELLAAQDQIARAEEKTGVINEKLTEVTKYLDTIQKYEDQISQLNIHLDKYHKFKDIDMNSVIGKFYQIDEDIRLRQETLGQLNQNLVDVEVELSQKKAGKVLPILIGLVAIVFVIGLILFRDSFFALFGIGILLAGLVFGFIANILSNPLRKEKQIAEKRVIDIKNILVKDEEKLENLITTYEVRNKEEFLNAKKEIDKTNNQIAQYKMGIKSILTNMSLQELKQTQIKLLTQKKEIEVNELPESLQKLKLSPENLLKNRQKYENLLKNVENLTKSYTESQTRYKDAKISGEEINLNTAELDQTNEKITRVKHKLKVLKKLKGTLEEVVADTSEEVGHIIATDIKKYLPNLTENRYKKLKINEKLEIKIHSDEKDDWVNPLEELSSGTKDIIFFLTKLGFFKLISGTNKPFILLDDPFLTLDTKRTLESFKLLKEIAKDYQIIMFLHTDFDLVGVNKVYL